MYPQKIASKTPPALFVLARKAINHRIYLNHQRQHMAGITAGDVQDKDWIADKVSKAILTHDRLPDREKRFVYAKQTWWPEINERWRYLDEADMRAIRQRYEPTRWDMDNWLEVFDWIMGAEQANELPLLRARAYEFSYRQIATQRGRSDEFWRLRHKRALEAIHAHARAQYPVAAILENVFIR